MSKALITNKQMLKVLGLQGLRVVSMDIACRVGELPLVTALIHPQGSPECFQQQFQLVAMDATAADGTGADADQPFDLDAMCKAAQERIKAHIDKCAAKHLTEITALEDACRKYGLTSFVGGGFVGEYVSPLACDAFIRSIDTNDHLARAFERTWGLQRKGR